MSKRCVRADAGALDTPWRRPTRSPAGQARIVELGAKKNRPESLTRRRAVRERDGDAPRVRARSAARIEPRDGAPNRRRRRRLHVVSTDRQLERGIIVNKIGRSSERYARVLRVNARTGALEAAPRLAGLRFWSRGVSPARPNHPRPASRVPTTVSPPSISPQAPLTVERHWFIQSVRTSGEVSTKVSIGCRRTFSACIDECRRRRRRVCRE